MFNSNTAPRVVKKDRGDKTWSCPSCGFENKPWWGQCSDCGKRKD